jgi:hypothetical protein
MSDGPGYPFGTSVPPLPPSGGRTGPPWEGSAEFVQRYVDTVRGVLTDPKGFYANMRLTGGLQAPVTFALVGIGINAIASAVYGSFGSAFGSFGGVGGGMPGSGFVSTLVAALVLGTIGLFIGAGIFHLMLSLLSAARQPFEATLRVVAYGMGATSLIGLIPICGGLIGGLYGIYLYIVGIADVHDTDMTKAAIAVLTPAVVCCVLIALLWGTIAALVFGAAAAGLATQ